MLPSKTMCLWPGLPLLWYRGDGLSLAGTLLFAAILNIALVATFLWPEWLSLWLVRTLWIGLALTCLVASIRSTILWNQIVMLRPFDANSDGALIEAQQYYLRGQYFEAEAVLHQLFAKGEEDVEAALLMVCILRRTRRYQQALQCIERLELIEVVGRWQTELRSERQRVMASIAHGERDVSEKGI